MAHTLNSDSSVISVFVYKVVRFFDNTLAEMAKRKEQRETFKALQSLSNRELNDIGISRGDIRSVANNTWHDNCKRDNTVRSNPNLRGFV